MFYNKIFLLILLLQYVLLVAGEHIVHQLVNNNASTQEIFTAIYQSNYWGSDESASGGGSHVATTETIRKSLRNLFEKLSIKTILDAACGDFNWMRLLNLENKQYIGIDIVKDIIEKNNRLYGSESKLFFCKDISVDALPQADVIICRDCLAHLSIKKIKEVIQNFKKSGSTYLLATTHIQTILNLDNKVGLTFPYNLQLPPFNFPAPLFLIEEVSAEDSSRVTRKSLGLWRLSDLINFGISNIN